MQTCTYLTFDGNCREAITFYADLLGGEIVAMLEHGDVPGMRAPAAEWGDKIIHALMKLGDREIMASDAPPQHYSVPQGFSVQLSVDSATEAKRIFEGLATGGRVTMPLGKTPWAEQFGMLVDRFQIPWMINYAPAG
jgi:PhnB protein